MALKPNQKLASAKRAAVKVPKARKYRVSPASFDSVLKAFGLKKSEFESTKDYVLSRVKIPAHGR